MHTRSVTAASPARPTLGLRVVDALITLRRATRAVVPGTLRRGALMAPALALVGLLAVCLALLAWRSLHAYDSFLAREGAFSFTQYSDALTDEQFHRVLGRTLLTAAIVPLVAVAIAVPFTLTMARSRRRTLRLALLIAMFVPILTGDITRTYGWLVTIGADGPVNWVSERLGLGQVELLGTLPGVGLGIVQLVLPVAVVILLPAVLRADRELEWAASTMGASPTRTFVHVTLPQLRTAIVAALATGFALSMAAFADPQIIGRGVKSFVGNYLQSRYLGLDNPPQGAAIGILLLAIVSLGTALILALGNLRPRRSR